MEEVRFGGDQCDPPPERRAASASQGDPVEPDLPALRLVVAEEQVHEGRFPDAALPDERHRPARGEGQRHAVEDTGLAAVGEDHAVKDDPFLQGDELFRSFRVVLRGDVEKLEYARKRCPSFPQRRVLAEEVLDRRDHLHLEGGERHKRPHGDRAVPDQPCRRRGRRAWRSTPARTRGSRGTGRRSSGIGGRSAPATGSLPSNLRSRWHSVALDRTSRIPVKVSMMRVPTAAFFSRISRLIPVITLRVNQRPSTPNGDEDIAHEKERPGHGDEDGGGDDEPDGTGDERHRDVHENPRTSTMSLLSRATISPTRVLPKKRISARSR